MSYNFHIGQDIVALTNHLQGLFKKDDVFTVKGLMESSCNCYNFLVDIGISDINSSGFSRCSKCNARTENKIGYAWFGNKNFAPLDSLTNIDELTEILEQPLFQL